MSFALLRRLLAYARPHAGAYALVLAASLVASGAALVFPLLVRHVAGDVLVGAPGMALVRLQRLGALMVALVALEQAAAHVVDYRGHEIGARIEGRMRRDLFRHIEGLSFQFFDGTTTGELGSRISNDLLLVSELCHHGPEDYLNFGIRFVGAVTIMAFLNLRLTLVVLCLLPPLLALGLYFNGRLNRQIRETKRRIAEINAQVEDTLGGIRVVQAFTGEQTELAKFEAHNDRFLRDRKFVYRTEAHFSAAGDGWVQLILVAIVIFGGAAIVRADLGLNDLIAFLLYIGFMIQPIQRLTHMSTQFQEGITGFQRFLEIMDLEPSIRSRPGAPPLAAGRCRGEIEFRHVSFRYGGQDPWVFEDLTCRISAGEYVALVGASGIGKTTLCSLIPRFYDAGGGAVLVDGTDVRDVDLVSLRSQIGVVQQDVYLFSGTVLENIRYGRPSATEAEVLAAARRADAHDFIVRLPHGYGSEIGQRGIRLSAGQRQRLTVARLFLKDPAILILDEATSALDNQSESALQASLETLAKGRTTIVVAHRLSTIRNAQRILLLGPRGIAEEGTHARLLAHRGQYAKLYATQFDL